MNIRKLLFLLSSFVVLVGGIYWFNSRSGITNVSAEDFLEESVDGFVYIGRPTCPHCEFFYPRLEKAIEESNVEVYYINTDNIENQETMEELKNITSVEFVTYLIEISDGEVVREFSNDVAENEEATLENLNSFFSEQ